MQRIAICDPIESARESLRGLLLGVDFVWLEAECARYEAFYDVIQDSSPDLVVINLDADRAKALALISGLSAEFPKLPVLAVSSDHQALLQSLTKGAKYFLTQPIVLEDLLSALRKAASESGEVRVAPLGGGGVGAMPSRQESQVVAVLGSRGGVGCTSLAVNLGCTLAKDQANNVALLDLDLALGDADVALDVMADHTIADLAMNIDRLDMNFIKRSLIRHQGSGLSLLTHPLQLQDIGMVHEEHLQRIVNLLKISYNYLILDLSKGLLPTDRMALQMANTILLVGQLELSSLRNVVRILLTLGTEEGLREKVKVVMNRVGSEIIEGDISLKKAEDTIGEKIFWQVPNDAKAMIGSRIAGVPLLQHAPKSKVQLSIEGLAAALTGKQAAPLKPAKKGWFG